jgi:hypothetical protein
LRGNKSVGWDKKLNPQEVWSKINTYFEKKDAFRVQAVIGN